MIHSFTSQKFLLESCVKLYSSLTLIQERVQVRSIQLHEFSPTDSSPGSTSLAPQKVCLAFSRYSPLPRATPTGLLTK